MKSRITPVQCFCNGKKAQVTSGKKTHRYISMGRNLKNSQYYLTKSFECNIPPNEGVEIGCILIAISTLFENYTFSCSRKPVPRWRDPHLGVAVKQVRMDIGWVFLRRRELEHSKMVNPSYFPTHFLFLLSFFLLSYDKDTVPANSSSIAGLDARSKGSISQ